MKKLILMTAVVLSVAGVAHARGPGGGGMGGAGMGGGSAPGQMQSHGNGQGKQEQKQIQERNQYQYQHRAQQPGMGGAATPQGPTFQNQERVRENIQTPGADVAR